MNTESSLYPSVVGYIGYSRFKNKYLKVQADDAKRLSRLRVPPRRIPLRNIGRSYCSRPTFTADAVCGFCASVSLTCGGGLTAENRPLFLLPPCFQPHADVDLFIVDPPPVAFSSSLCSPPMVYDRNARNSSSSQE